MPTESTELSPPELELAQARLREMAEKFVVDGTLRSPQWRAAFTRTWRHPYVPSYYPELGVPPISATEQSQRSQWLHAVYTDETLITKVVRVQFRPPLAPGSYPMYTCSSTAPVLMLTMLEAPPWTARAATRPARCTTGSSPPVACKLSRRPGWSRPSPAR